jgi:lycopene beta-cyclase
MSGRIVLVGGGLANALIAWRLNMLRPDLQITVIEQGQTLGGNHTWCFHTSDITPEQMQWLSPLLKKSWDGYDIRFPKRQRHLSGGYHCITSDKFHTVISSALGKRVTLNSKVQYVGVNSVQVEDGRRYDVECVIDGRGDMGSTALDVGYQKFLGQVVELDGPHELETPILMDATVEQIDGFRFMYSLPLSPRQILIEDTRYSNGPELARPEMEAEIARYASAQGWPIHHIVRQEEGVLPVVMGGDIKAFWSDEPGLPRSGVRAGLFHYTTGYSLPEAVRLADDLAAREELSSSSVYAFVRARSEELWRQGQFFRKLNRMLFLAAEPDQRYKVLEHFYRLPTRIVNRFYAGTPTTFDRFRILSGKPPVPVGAALSSLRGQR